MGEVWVTFAAKFNEGNETDMKLLLIEDDKNFRDILTFQLEQEGFWVDICDDGADVMYYLEQNSYDLILLDRMLPHVDGITVLKKLRGREIHTPVIILTALGEIDDRITGLDTGADDYLVKPFDFKELLARIRCIRRRPSQLESNSSIEFGDIAYAPERNQLFGSLGNCTLSKKEGGLMEFFLRNHDQILPREMILSHVWGPYGDVENGNLDNYIHFIRRRLKSVSSTVSIKTIRSVGYQLIENTQKRDADYES